jgi:cysteine synthase
LFHFLTFWGCYICRLIEDAEEKGLITPGITTLVAVTSGNLGIGVAFVAAQKGYKFIAVMPAKVAIDKQILLRYLGIDVILVGKKLCSMSMMSIEKL